MRQCKCGKEIWKHNKSGMCVACITRSPEGRAARSKRLKEIWNDPERAAKMGWLAGIPIELRETYMVYARKGYKAAEIRKILGVNNVEVQTPA